jgi:uncharacterized protein YgbK (DUF1537 family)
VRGESVRTAVKTRSGTWSTEEDVPRLRLVLIADDLTGAADSGVQFVKRGFSTALAFGDASPAGAEVLIVDTESRGDAEEVARAKVHAIASSLPPAECIYKKMDSTLRGNVGAELAAIMEARCLERAVVAPAFPHAGRTTVGGRQLLHGRRLEETAFAQDPLCPITDSYLPGVLARQMEYTVGLIGLALVREGVEFLTQAMQAHGEAVLVVDAADERDLETIAHAAAQASLARLTCGSAGLADAIAKLLGAGHAAAGNCRAREALVLEAPALVVAASRNPLTGLQLSRAAREIELAVLSVDPLRLAADPELEIGRMMSQASQWLDDGRSVALSAVDGRYVPGLSGTVAEALGEVASRLVTRHTMAGLVVTGGDVALAVCAALGAAALSLIGEVAPGIPVGRIGGGPHAGLSLVTKAGGFGREDAIVTSIRFLRGSLSSSAEASGFEADWSRPCRTH